MEPEVTPPVKNKHIHIVRIYLTFILTLVVLEILAVLVQFQAKNHLQTQLFPSQRTFVKTFTSESDFKDYLKKGEGVSGAYPSFGRGGIAVSPNISMDITAPSQLSTGIAEKSAPTAVAQDISGTNVQVKGIDEPDIIKTDGSKIYFSIQDYYYPMPLPFVRPQAQSLIAPDSKIVGMPNRYNPATRVIKAFPPKDLSEIAKIEKTGDLLLNNNILVVFENNNLYGFDVSNPSVPRQKWNMKLDQNFIVSSRLYGSKIYLVVGTNINSSRPCPIEPILMQGKTISIPCSQIYHPVAPVPVNTTYTAMLIDINNGNMEKSVSFVGSTDNSQVYMSQNSLFITYSYFEDYTNFMFKFFSSEGRNIIPESVLAKLNKLQSYDISSLAKQVEFDSILEDYYGSLTSDERLKIENEMTNKTESYLKAHKRDFEKTGIVKIAFPGFSVKATGEVAGRPLNQFSLDEYNGNLRIATTIQGFIFGSSESVSDVYVLDGNLNKIGVVSDLGQKERIYSVRFIEDKGYVVTFRQTDPFYVLDLSNPSNPQLKGELKIPGYSSYLDRIAKDRILGIGKEGNRVKLSLFDVSDPSNPKEAAKYMLDEYSSDVLNNHHAFLLDPRNNVFFLPGGKGGYIFSYKNDDLILKRAVGNIQAKRAIYMDNYMYIVGNDKIVVLDETNWKEVNDLEF